MNNKRSGKFYRKNEAEIMRDLGLKPTVNSGSTWIEKEDGQNDYIICQLKSTDAESIRVAKKDIDTLEYNATVARKIPVFAINFLSDNSVYLLVRPEDLNGVSEYIEVGSTSATREGFVGVDTDAEDVGQKQVRKIKSSEDARKRFYEEKEKKYDKTRKAR